MAFKMKKYMDIEKIINEEISKFIDASSDNEDAFIDNPYVKINGLSNGRFVVGIK